MATKSAAQLMRAAACRSGSPVGVPSTATARGKSGTANVYDVWVRRHPPGGVWLLKRAVSANDRTRHCPTTGRGPVLADGGELTGLDARGTDGADESVGDEGRPESSAAPPDPGQPAAARPTASSQDA